MNSIVQISSKPDEGEGVKKSEIVVDIIII